MLKKLIKYDFLETYKTNAIILLSMSVIALTTLITSSKFFIMELVLSAAILIGPIIAFLLLVRHFNNDLFSVRGYLKNTVPATKSQLVTSKIIVSMVWISIIFMAAVLMGATCFRQNSGLYYRIIFEMLNKEGLLLKFITLQIVSINVTFFWIFQTIFFASSFAVSSFATRKTGPVVSILVTGAFCYMQMIITKIISDAIPVTVIFTNYIWSGITLAKISLKNDSFVFVNDVTSWVVTIIFSCITYLLTVKLLEKHSII